MIRVSSILALSLAGCGHGGNAEDAVVRLNWTAGEEFHVATTYRVANAKTEEIPVSLDGSVDPAFGDHWSDEVVWTYQVVEEGLLPSPSDELYDFAVDGDTVTPISVIRAWVDLSLNDDPDMIEADPVIYLVFRETNNRLVGMAQFVNVDGERAESAWKDGQVDRSWSPLAQSMLTGLPTYLAPAGARWSTDERLLENGDRLNSEAVDANTVDVFFDDTVGGGLVSTRYEAGQPWPTWTVTDNVEAHLLTADEVARRRAERPWQLPDVPASYDYLGALRAGIDINAALKLDSATMAGGWTATVPDGYKPWAGSWWPQSEGAMIFGYDRRPTLSGRLKAQIDPMKRELDTLSTQLRSLQSGSADYNTKYATYKTKQAALQTAITTFYDKVLQDLDGGKIKIVSGKLTHASDGWSYDIDKLSPMDKFALQLYYAGSKSPNPFYMPAWEILNHYSPGGGSWWGHCNGWSGAAILTNEPRASVSATMGTATVKYEPADLKALFSEAHYSTYSQFYGARYNGDAGDDVSDLTPKAFHTIVSHYLRDRQVPFVFDIIAKEEVWNYPIYSMALAVTETTQGGAPAAGGLVNINTADKAGLITINGVGPSTADKIIAYRSTYGAFQVIEDLMKVSGIKQATFDKLKGQITVSTATPATGARTFHVAATGTLADDGVAYTHIDGPAPENMVETWGYTLTTDKDGNVTGGTWDDNEHHPDFAWVPYDNPTAASSGNSENPYLPYGKLLDTVGKTFRRQ